MSEKIEPALTPEPQRSLLPRAPAAVVDSMTETCERWCLVPWGYPYEVSNLGRLRRTRDAARCRAGTILRGSRDGKGYLRFCLSDSGRRRSVAIHWLVAWAFLGPPPSASHQVNHLNGNKRDNRAANLEWATCGENVRHSFRVLGREPVRAHKKLREEDVRDIRLLHNSGLTSKDVAARYGIDTSMVRSIMRGHSWSNVA